MSITLVIALVAAALVLLLAMYVATRPSTFRVARSRRVTARPAEVFAKVVDFHEWTAWSPWEQADPQVRREFAGPQSGVGASYHWIGGRKVGEGRMTITEARAAEHIGIDIEFIRPFAGRNRVTFDFVADGDGTIVTQAMSGRAGLVHKLMGLVMDCDGMIGGMYEKALAQLARECEGAAAR